MLLAQILDAFVTFLALFFLTSRFGAVDDFSLSDVLLCYGIVISAFGLAECFFRGFDCFESLVNSGEFDRILVRPRNVILQIVGAKIDFKRIGKLAQAVPVLLYAMLNSDVHWSWNKLLTVVFMIVSTTAVFTGLFILHAAICFFTIQGLEIVNVFIYGGRDFAQYPMSIYGKSILRIFTYLIPLAVVQYYPLLYVLGRETSLFYMFVPLFGIIFLLACLLFWNFGLKHYKSVGS